MALLALVTSVAGCAAGLFRSWAIVSAGFGLPPGQLLVVDMPGDWVILALTAIGLIGVRSLPSAPRFSSALFLAGAIGYGVMVTALAVPASIFLAVAAGSALMIE